MFLAILSISGSDPPTTACIFSFLHISNNVLIYCGDDAFGIMYPDDVSNNPMLVGDELVAIILYFCEAM